MKTTIINKILLVLMLITAQQVSALEFQVDGIYYRTSIFTKNSAYVTHSGTSYTESVEYQGEVVIPESVTYNGKTYTIASIGGYAFAGCPGLTSVTIPNTVTTINQNAFNGCTGLKTIECKATTPPALGDNAFTSYDATLVVPSSSESAYKSAAGWSNFKFKEESSETPGSGENSGEDNTGGGSDSGEDNGSDNGSDSGSDSGSDNGGDSGSSTVPEACYLVGNYNGWYTPTEENVDELYTLTDPDKDGVYYGKFYFDKGQFSFKIFITIGGWESGNYFGTDKKITMDNITGFLSVSYEGSAYNFECSDWNGGYVEIFFDFKNNTIRFTIPNENNTLVYKITSSTDVEVVAGTEKYTGDIVIPSQTTIDGKTYNVTKIGIQAFNGCAGLTSITIPSSVVSLGEGAFFDCTGLTSISIPNSVTSIGENVFAYCENLKTVTLSNKIKTISFSAFSGCYSLTGIEIPNSVTTIDEEAFSYCESITNITIGENVNSIGKCAFMSCNGLSRISTLNPTPPTCGENVFKNVNVSNVTLTVPTGSVSKYKSADIWKDFKYEQTEEDPSEPELPTDNSGLSYNILNETDVEVVGGTEKYTGDIVIPSQTTIDGKVYNVTSIGYVAFAYCSGLTSVTIPNSVTNIGNYAFYGCSGLTSVTIPNSVTSIGRSAFAYCSGLISVTIPNNVTSIGNDAFINCNGLTSIVVESGNTVYDSRDNCNAIIETSTNILITGCKNTVIPNSVTGIGSWAFSSCSGLTSITIPNSVTSIGEAAFFDCSGLTSIVVESGNTVYDSRNNCNAIIETSTSTLITGCKNTVIPNSITSIGNYAFSYCIGLTSITIPNSVTSIGDYAFVGCSGLTSITIPNSVTFISSDAFQGCSGLTSVTIGNSVTSIGERAFSGCNRLTSITIPNSVTSIGRSAFAYCSGLESIIVESGNIVYDSRDNCNAIIETSTNILITGCKNTVIPNSVTGIGEYAFCDCSGLTSISIPSSVTSIGNYAFWDCSGLTSIISLNPTPPTCGTTVFGNVSVGIITLEVPAESISMYQSADTWKDFGTIKGISEEEPELPEDTSGLSYNILNETDVEVVAGTEKYTGDIVIPSQTTIDGKVYNVTKVGDKAFYECTGLISITIPNSVTSISNYAYFGCTGLTSVTIPNSVTSIGNYAFSGCNGLTIITISNSVTSIGDNAFGYCSGLTSVTIPNSVTFIGAAAFRGCSGLTSITISERVTIIGESAFSDCSGLESIYVESENTVYDSRDNCNAIIEKSTNKLITGCKNSVIPNSVTSIGSCAFSGCSGLTRITIPNSVTSIGSRAFNGCSGLTSITIPNSVTSIGDFAFTFCSGLTSVIIGSSVTSIDNFAFYYCSGLSSVISLSTTPPMCGGTDVFGYVSVENITLEVPSVSVSLYQSADIWKRFGTIKGIVVEESGGSDNEEIISGYKITKQWTVPVDATTGQCSIRTATGYGDSLFGSNYQAGVIEEWKDGVLVASYDVNKFCADNQLGETDKVIDSETGTETEKFTSYVLWTAVMVDDAGNVLANVGTGLGSAKTCQNWVLLPASNRNAMQLLHIDEFPSADVTLGRVDVPSRIVGNITDGGAYLYIPATGSALMPVVYIGLDDAGKIYYDNDFSWVLPSGLSFDSSTNVATFQTAEDILNATDEAGIAAKTYIRWRAQSNPFTWNAETSQFEKNTTIPQGASAAGMDVFKLGGVEYIVLPINSATTSMRGYSIGVYKLVDGSEVATWDAGTTNSSYVGSILARVNDDGKTANIYVCGWYECFGILKFEPESVSATSEKESMSFGNASSALDEIVTEENAAVEYYNLQGVRVMNPEKGIYIKRQGGKTSKVVL